jgi:hypothetical protein
MSFARSFLRAIQKKKTDRGIAWSRNKDLKRFCYGVVDPVMKAEGMRPVMCARAVNLMLSVVDAKKPATMEDAKMMCQLGLQEWMTNHLHLNQRGKTPGMSTGQLGLRVHEDPDGHIIATRETPRDPFGARAPGKGDKALLAG